MFCRNRLVSIKAEIRNTVQMVGPQPFWLSNSAFVKIGTVDATKTRSFVSRMEERASPNSTPVDPKSGIPQRESQHSHLCVYYKICCCLTS